MKRPAFLAFLAFSRLPDLPGFRGFRGRRRAAGQLRATMRGAALAICAALAAFRPGEGLSFRPRQLGSFEGVLARSSAAGKLDLPHVCAATFTGPKDVSEAQVREALAHCAHRHPLLRARIAGRPPLPEKMVVENVRLGANTDPLRWEPLDGGAEEAAERALRFSEVDGPIEGAWQSLMAEALNEWALEDRSRGPLFRVQWVSEAGGAAHACILLFNHAISDQTSANALLADLQSALSGRPAAPPAALPLPPTVEEAVLGPAHAPDSSLRDALRTAGPATALYGATQVAHGLAGAPTLTERVARMSADERVRGGLNYEGRETRLAHRVLGAGAAGALRERCRAEGTTVTGALVAAVGRGAAAALAQKAPTLRILMSLDMRRFGAGAEDWTGGTLCCAGGATDFVWTAGEELWEAARSARKKTVDFISDPRMPKESVRLFDIGSRLLDMPTFVAKEGRNNMDSLGRAYSAGVSNAGVFEPADGAGEWRIGRVHYATSHSHTGCLFQISAVSVGGDLCLTFQTPMPLLLEEEADAFVGATMEALAAMAGAEAPPGAATDGDAAAAARGLAELNASS